MERPPPRGREAEELAISIVLPVWTHAVKSVWYAWGGDPERACDGALSASLTRALLTGVYGFHIHSIWRYCPSSSRA